jgi:hypothetical protein
MARSMNVLAISGVVLIAAGGLGLASPVFVTQRTTTVLQIGDAKLQANESVPHVVPPLLSGSVLAIGVVLLGAGLYRRK